MSRRIVQDSIDKLVNEVNLMDACYQLPIRASRVYGIAQREPSGQVRMLRPV